MKKLYIIRHAKSSWTDPMASDFERGLNDRGKSDAPKMGKRFKEKEIHPDVIVSSAAKRALSTARRISEIIKFRKERIKTDSRLYHANEDTILSVVREIKDKHDIAMIFGHNPGLTGFVNDLSSEEIHIDNIPTCGIVAFSLPVDSWKDITWNSGKMLFFDYPKSTS